jgi:curved DNA-binding protein CbpA
MKLNEALEILRVPGTADLNEIKAAYRKRVLETHPDKGGDAKEFIRVRPAYEIACSFFKVPDVDDDFPIPEDLRSVISEIVREFKVQFDRSEELCAKAFSEFNNKMRAQIASASRDQLEKFGEAFRTEWNKLVCNLFESFNMKCRETIRKYEGWFQKTMEETFEEIYKRQLGAFSTSPTGGLFGLN